MERGDSLLLAATSGEETDQLENGKNAAAQESEPAARLVVSPLPPPTTQPNAPVATEGYSESDKPNGAADGNNPAVNTTEAILATGITSFSSSVESTPPLHTDEPVFSMNPDDYEIGPAIGFGSSAIVYYATYTPINFIVSVKMIDLDHFERNQIDELRREIQVMTLCKHLNLLKILASFVHKSKLWIITPYLSGGSCLDIMKTGFRDGLEESAIATILYQTLQGLEYLHRNGHIHRDVKAGNLLMDKDGSVQLADFGVSSSLMEDMERKGLRKTFVGTPCWMAPEVMEMNCGYNVKADIWSFGITALELSYGHAPFAKYPPMKVIYLTLSSNPPTLDRKRAKNKYSRAFKEMIDSCLQRDPSKRPTAESLLKHPFFKAAKKKIFLVSSVLSTIPPLEQRPRTTKLIKQVAANSAGEQLLEKVSTEWNFSSDSETSEIITYRTEPSTAPETPEAENDRPHLASNPINGDKRCSRFVIESETRSAQSADEEGRDSKGLLGKMSFSAEALGSEHDDNGVRKGRFSVLETVNTGKDSPGSPQKELLISSAINPEEVEEGRRSRFKVVGATPEAINENTAPGYTIAQPVGLGRFQVSGGKSFHAKHNSMMHHVLEAEQYTLGNQSTRIDLNSHDFGHYSGYYSNYAGDLRGENNSTLHRDHQSSLILCHQSQLDQLLMLNDLIRQQLIELRNSSNFRLGRSESELHTRPPTNLSRNDHPVVQWDHSNRGAVQQDPRAALPFHLSAYSPVAVANDAPWGVYPEEGRQAGHSSHGINRYSTIDQRKSINSGNPAHSVDLGKGPPVPGPPVGGAFGLPNHTNHRSVQSLKSPVTVPTASQYLNDFESIRREVEHLRRENEQLRKRS